MRKAVSPLLMLSLLLAACGKWEALFQASTPLASTAPVQPTVAVTPSMPTPASSSALLPTVEATPTTSVSELLVEGILISVIPPPGYALTLNPEQNRRGSIVTYDFRRAGAYELPQLAEVQFFSKDSIRNFIQHCQTTAYPCFFGDYPDAARYTGQKEAFGSGQPYEGAALQTLGAHTYFVVNRPCQNDACIIREYTTFLGALKVDVWAMLSDESQGSRADVLAAQVAFRMTTSPT